MPKLLPVGVLWPGPEELPVLMIEVGDPAALCPELKEGALAALREGESAVAVACPFPPPPELPFHRSQAFPLLDLPEGSGVGLRFPCPDVPPLVELRNSDRLSLG